MGERERHRPPSQFRVVPAHEPVETPGSTPAVDDLRARGLLKLIGRLPAWGQVIVFAGLTFGAGAGASVAGMAKALGVQTTAQAKADKDELLKRMGADHGQLVDLIQGARNQQLSPATMVFLSKEIEAAVSRASLSRAHKPKPAARRPAETEDQSP